MLDFDNKKLNLTIGLLCLFLIVIAVIIAKLVFNDNDYHNYYVKIDNLNGINKNDDILLNGYKIGYIKDYSLINGEIFLQLKVKKNIEITKDSFFKISTSNMLSNNKSLNLILGFEDLVNENTIFTSKKGMDLNDILNLLGVYLSLKN